MRSLIPLLVATFGFAAVYLGARRGFRRAYPVAWARPAVRRAVHVVPLVWGASMLAAGLARAAGANGVAHVSFAVAAWIVVVLLCTLGPLLVAGAIRRWADPVAADPVAADPVPADPTPADPTPADPALEAAPGIEPARESQRPPPPPSGGATRRQLLVRASAALPAGGVGLAAVGGAGGFAAAQLQRLEMTFPDLPRDLEGLRLLHYTDMHLGTYVDLLEVERLVELGRAANPDLVLLTGDMSDDLDRLLPALRRFESLRPKHGVLASIGNHEYFRGLRQSLVAYARTDVQMLIEQGVTLKIGDASLFVGGADDPQILRGDKMDFMHRTVHETLDGAPSEAFRILLSHRPEGFVPGSQAGFHLTLSGHTHGGQLGFDGRSLLEGFMPDRYLWGAYAAGDRRLYTSSGAGHWFPFRLGCPREVPLIVLRRGPSGGVVKKTRLA